MNKKQAIAILIIVLAIFLSLVSLFFNMVFLKADNIDLSSQKDNVTLGYGTIQLQIEPQQGALDDKAKLQG